MRLYGVRIFVDDLATARRFYGEVLELPEAWAAPDPDGAGLAAVGFRAGTAELIVEPVAQDGAHDRLAGRFVGVSLQVDDIEATYRELLGKGVAFSGPPARQFWGGTLAHFKDPAGNTLTLLGAPPPPPPPPPAAAT